ncbi:MAG: deoxyribose-phosphate aldolase [Pseudomonadota bacterium]
MSAMKDLDLARTIISMIDLTNLNDDCTRHDIDDLCANARAAEGRPATAAVCVWPSFVAQSKRALSGTQVRVATVVNFPKGGTDTAAVLAETAKVLEAGADEIDLVFPYTAWTLGDVSTATEQVQAIRAAIHAPVQLKVIIETGELANQDLIRAASLMCIEEGADFIKTSTGKVAENATLDSARIMLTAIAEAGQPVGFKPAGGIRTFDEARDHLALAGSILGEGWATPQTYRFGASSLLASVEAVLTGGDAAPATGY